MSSSVLNLQEQRHAMLLYFEIITRYSSFVVSHGLPAIGALLVLTRLDYCNAIY